MNSDIQPIIAYKNIPELRDLAIANEKRHISMDMLIKGTYGINEGSAFKGCTIGCHRHDMNVSTHEELADAYGLPVWLMYTLDILFENLPEPENKQATLKILTAIKAGQDLTNLHHVLAIKRNKRLLKLKPVIENKQVYDAIELCIDAHKAAIKGDKSKLKAAANAANAAADAANAANAAADAAGCVSAAYAAYAAAYAAKAADAAADAAGCVSAVASATTRFNSYKNELSNLIESIEESK